MKKKRAGLANQRHDLEDNPDRGKKPRPDPHTIRNLSRSSQAEGGKGLRCAASGVRVLPEKKKKQTSDVKSVRHNNAPSRRPPRRSPTQSAHQRCMAQWGTKSDHLGTQLSTRIGRTQQGNLEGKQWPGRVNSLGNSAGCASTRRRCAHHEDPAVLKATGKKSATSGRRNHSHISPESAP